MALKESGVRLVAADQQAFMAALAAANGAVNALGIGSAGAAQQIDKLSGRIEFQKRSLGILAQELNATKAKYGEGSVQAQKKQLALDKLTASIGRDEAALARLRQQQAAAASSSAQLASGFDRAGQGASRLGEVMTGALRRAGELAVNLFMRIGQGIADGIGQAVDMAGDYEQAMDVMAAQSGATAEQMEQVRATAKALGADLTLPATSAVDAGNAMLELSKGGLSVEDAMNAAKGTLQLAAAAQTDVATAANITTGALSAFGLEGEQAGYVADLLTNAANKSRASITDLGQGFQQAAFRFRSAGQGADDLAASLTILINKGLSGSDAGTALQNAIARLQGPTDKAAKLMHQLGINVYDANGNMLPMEDIIGVLNGAFEGMTQQERNAALQTIFLSDGMKAMIPLLDAGRDGFLQMKDEVNEAGSAQAMAAAQMQGLKGAAAGLQSQVETLALEALEPLLPIMAGVLSRGAEIAGSFVGQVGPAVRAAIDFFTQAGEVVSTVALPALGGLTAAVIAYAVAQTVQAIPAILASLPAIAAQTGAFVANALAVAAAAAPYALIAAAVGVMIFKLQELNEKNRAATDQLLESRPWWTDSTAAIESYGNASGEAAGQLAPYAATIQAIREQIRGEVQDLALRREAGVVNDEQLGQELATINQHSEGLRQATAAYNEQEQAILRDYAARITDTGQIQEHTAALAGNTAQADLTQEELDALAQKLEEIYQRGTQAVSDYVTAAAGFLSTSETQQTEHQQRLTDLYAEMNRARTDDERIAVQERIDAENEGYAEQEKAAALAYAQQAAAQRAHLGQMLSDYTLTQVQLGRITEDQADVIIGQIERQFGVADDTSARTFLHMQQHIREAAENGGESLNSLGETLGRTADDAVTTRQRMDELAKEYTMKLIENTPEAERNTKAYLDALARIPAYVRTIVEIEERRRRYEETGVGNNRGQYDGFATGGSFLGRTPIIVGEAGRELLFPRGPGTIMPHDATERMLAMGATMNRAVAGLTPPGRVSPPATAGQIMNRTSVVAPVYNQQRSYHYAPTYAETPRAPAVDFGAMAALGA